MAHCPIAQLIGPNLSALLCGATGFTSPVLSSVFPGISTPFQGFARDIYSRHSIFARDSQPLGG
jgi:hypothetical protein